MKRITIKHAAEILGASQQFVRIGLQRGSLPIGVAEKMPNSTRYTYYISPKLLKEFTLVDYLKQTDGDDKVSISSPLGSAIYHKQIGSTQSYQAPNGTISVEILEKKLPLEEEQAHGRV